MKRKKNRYPEDLKRQLRYTTLKAAEKPGVYELSVAIQQLPIPEREFYANAAGIQRHENYVTFYFGQTGSRSAISNGVALDLPYRMLRPIQRTFDANFRDKVAGACARLGKVHQWYATRDTQYVTFPSHLAKMAISEFAGVIDFYELEPNPTGPPPILGVIRIKSLPAVVRWFVDTTDQLVAELPEDLKLEEEPPQ